MVGLELHSFEFIITGSVAAAHSLNQQQLALAMHFHGKVKFIICTYMLTAPHASLRLASAQALSPLLEQVRVQVDARQWQNSI